MVRSYKRKGNDPSYNKDDIKVAVRAIKSGRMTIYKASRTYNIPYATIYSHTKGTRGMKKANKGRLTVLTQEQEEELAAGITTLEKWGFGLSKKEVLQMVADFVKENEIKTPFKEGVPGTDWFISFKNRHALSIKIPQSVEYARKKATDPFLIYGYFSLLKETLSELQLLNRPSQIWNLDESSFCIDPSKTKVVGKRGKPCSRITSTPGRENTTVCLLASASGEKGPPSIIFKGANIWDQWQTSDEIFPGMSYAASKKGWMDSTIFLNYFKNTVIPALGEERPVLIIYDGHSTHMTISIIELAREQNITILKLPAHTTHLLQPLDLAVFKAVKTAWDQRLVKWQRHNVGRKLPKNMFSQFIAEIWRDASAAIIINGFKKAGIVPFNDQVVAREKFDVDALKRWDAVNSAPNSLTNDNAQNQSPNGSIQVTATNDLNTHDAVEASTPSTSTVHPVVSASCGPPTSSGNCNFETLLLGCVRQHQGTPKIPKKRLAPGAAVITANRIPSASLTETQRKQSQQKVIRRDSTSSDTDSEVPTYQDSDDPEEFLDELRNSVENDFVDDHGTIEVNRWVLVQYATKKTTKYYVGKVIEKNGADEWQIKFARFRKNKFIWPNVEDEDIVDSANIVRILPEPTEDRRGITFSVKFDGLNLC